MHFSILFEVVEVDIEHDSEWSKVEANKDTENWSEVWEVEVSDLVEGPHGKFRVQAEYVSAPESGEIAYKRVIHLIREDRGDPINNTHKDSFEAKEISNKQEFLSRVKEHHRDKSEINYKNLSFPP